MKRKFRLIAPRRGQLTVILAAAAPATPPVRIALPARLPWCNNHGRWVLDLTAADPKGGRSPPDEPGGKMTAQSKMSDLTSDAIGLIKAPDVSRRGFMTV